jgi:hypothetical protein
LFHHLVVQSVYQVVSQSCAKHLASRSLMKGAHIFPLFDNGGCFSW